MINFLKKVSLFSDLNKTSLEKIAQGSVEIKLPKGRVLFKQGDKAEMAYVIKQGKLAVIKEVGDKEILLAIRKRTEIIGEIALLEGDQRTATIKAATDSILIGIDKKTFENLLKNSYSATKTILKTVLKRWQKTEHLRRQSEKMAQLGVLTAGIAHELNNPAAAVQRGTKTIISELESNSQLSKKIFKQNLTSDQEKLLAKARVKVIDNAKKIPDIDLLSRIEKEEAVENWLLKNNISDAADLAVHSVNANLSKSDLENLANHFKDNKLSLVIHFLCSTFSVFNLFYEINLGSSQISEIVKSLKTYIYLDQGPVQWIKVEKGIEDTLVILRHKLKKGIKIIKHYDKNLPEIQAYGSELNQVWTNLIDNAIDAMDGKGILTISTNQDSDNVYVKIQDNGTGITVKNKSKIFDPFFTTKEPGKGTGLGLDISYNIIVHKHKGDISFKSKPGKTIFTVKLPKKIKP